MSAGEILDWLTQMHMPADVTPESAHPVPGHVDLCSQVLWHWRVPEGNQDRHAGEGGTRQAGGTGGSALGSGGSSSCARTARGGAARCGGGSGTLGAAGGTLPRCGWGGGLGMASCQALPVGAWLRRWWLPSILLNLCASDPVADPSCQTCLSCLSSGARRSLCQHAQRIRLPP